LLLSAQGAEAGAQHGTGGQHRGSESEDRADYGDEYDDDQEQRQHGVNLISENCFHRWFGGISGPQGLKPVFLMALNGTAEAVPYPKPAVPYPKPFMRRVLDILTYTWIRMIFRITKYPMVCSVIPATSSVCPMGSENSG